MKFEQVVQLLEKIAPTEWFEEEDNSGVQIHTGAAEINKVLVCLELNDAVIDEAIDKGADLIVTHHPLLFYPINRIDQKTPVGRYVIRLIQAGISVFSSHIAFDAAVQGNNMYLAKLLKLQDVAVPEYLGEEGDWDLDDEDEDDQALPGPDGFEYDPDEVGSIGYLPVPMRFTEFQRYVERCLDLPQHYVRCVDGGKPVLSKVAFCTGAGGSFLETAIREHCDAYITGDLRLHEAQLAKASGLTVIDAGHYGTEKIFTENMAAQLRELADGRLAVLEAEANTNPYTL